MKKAYLGIDIGSISTKGVLIDEENHILRSSYLWTEGSPINAVKKVLKELFKENGGFTGNGGTHLYGSGRMRQQSRYACIHRHIRE